MKTKKHLVSILAGLTLMFTSILPVQAFDFTPIDPVIPMIPLFLNPVYVDCSGGIDTNAGTSASLPVKTITKAIAIANAGTQTNYQIYVAEGSCLSETFPLAITSKDISIYGGYYNSFASRDPENHLTQIRGGNVNAIEITNHSSSLSGFKIYDQTLGNATIYVDNSAAQDNSVFIEGIEINNITAINAAIYATVEPGDTLTISNNYFNNLSTFFEFAIEIVGAGTSKVYNNFIYDTKSGISAESTTVYNNIISKFTSIGLNLRPNTKAYNNTIVNGNTGIRMGGAYGGVEFRNNLSAYNTSKGLDLTAGMASYSNNGYYDNDVAHTLGAGDVDCNPMLPNINSTSTNDYKLGAGSTCIDKGTEVSVVTKDFFGSARKKDGNNDAVYATDIGVHEADGDTAAAPSITAFTASPNTFSPDADGVNDTTTISYTLNVTTNVIVAIYDGSTLVKQLTNAVQSSGVHNVVWDGKNSASSTMGEATYTFKITAQNSESTDEELSNVTIDFGTTTPPSSLCAGFTDVAFDDPLCPAITYVKNEGIFQGYPDGTFRLYNVINRVETTKVVLEGFNISLLADNGTNLGFNDVVLGEWYMTYLRTGKAEGIIQGYPDGSFRPNQQVNRVEMLKIFLETSGEDLSSITVTNPPYPDTPINQWYIVYVQFSKNHALVDAASNGNFNPAEGMQRGDVAELFYRAHQEGII